MSDFSQLFIKALHCCALSRSTIDNTIVIMHFVLIYIFIASQVYSWLYVTMINAAKINII